MKKGNIFTVAFRRKREGKTNYKKRLKLLLSDKPRFVIRKSSKDLNASIIKYEAKGDKTLFTINSKALIKLGWKGNKGNIPSAYLIGLIAGKKAIGIGISDAILDLGFNKSVSGSRLYAALAGAIDAGLKIPFNHEVLPKKDRVTGEHVLKYAKILKDDQLKYEKQFSSYLKSGLKPEDIVKHFEEIKGKI